MKRRSFFATIAAGFASRYAIGASVPEPVSVPVPPVPAFIPSGQVLVGSYPFTAKVAAAEEIHYGDLVKSTGNGTIARVTKPTDYAIVIAMDSGDAGEAIKIKLT